MLKKLAFTIAASLVFSLHSQHVFAQNEKDNQYIILYDQTINKDSLEKMNVKIVHEYSLIPAVLVDSKPSVVSTLSNKDKHIEQIYENKKHKLVSAQTNDWGFTTIGVPKTFTSGFRGNGINVAVIDSGVSSSHPDLTRSDGKSVVTTGTSFVSEFGDSSFADYNGHGTHVTGIIAAQDNTIGKVGISPNVNILAVKVLNSEGDGYLSDVLSGMEWAVNHGAKVINMSLGFDQDEPSLKAMSDAVVNAGVSLVVAAGNESDYGQDLTKNNVLYPAKYDASIAVGATNSSNTRAYFSSVGKEVEVSAPGEDVTSTYLLGTYKKMSGTSMATPYVSGLMALYRQAFPTATAAQIRQLLIANTLDLGKKGRDVEFGYGLVQSFTKQNLTQKITFFETRPLYSLPNTSYSTWSVSPQTVTSYETFNNWYHIHTYDGDKWVKSSDVLVGEIEPYNTSLTLLSPYDLKNMPSDSASTSSRVAPQTLQITGKFGNWYRVKTWLGDKWIKQTANFMTSDPVIDSTKLTLTKNTTVYSLPSIDSSVLFTVAPQTVTSVSKYNNWYKIRTWKGDYWIQPSDYLTGDAIDSTFDLLVMEKTILYSSPTVIKGDSVIGPQVVQVKKTWGDWYQIQTWLGDKWIHPLKAVKWTPIVESKNISLTSTTTMYEYPDTSTLSKGTLVPQTVTSFESLNGWYHIKTWLGNLWVKPQ